MNDLKSIIAKNISDLRKERGMTQLQLAEHLNYSDKAISKWERGESVPDITVLVKIAELFSVTVDYIVTEEHTAEQIEQLESHEKLKAKNAQALHNNRKAITGIAIQAVWLVAIICFVPISLIWPNGDGKWLCFVWAVPASAIVWLVFNSIWFNQRRNYLIVSILMWSIFACLNFTLSIFNINIYHIYLLGLPGELIIILWSIIRKNPSSNKEKP